MRYVSYNEYETYFYDIEAAQQALKQVENTTKAPYKGQL